MVEVKLGSVSFTEADFELLAQQTRAKTIDLNQIEVDVHLPENPENDSTVALEPGYDPFSFLNIGWNVRISELALQDSKVNYSAGSQRSSREQIDFSQLNLELHTLRALNCLYAEDTIGIDLQELSFQEHSGFALDALETSALLTREVFSIRDLVARTPQSDMHLHLAIDQPQHLFLDRWEESVFHASCENTRISGKDLNFFIPEPILSADRAIDLDANLLGNPNHLEIRKFRVQTGDHAAIALSGVSRGIPGKDSIFIQGVIDTVYYTSREEVLNLAPTLAQDFETFLPEQMT